MADDDVNKKQYDKENANDIPTTNDNTLNSNSSSNISISLTPLPEDNSMAEDIYYTPHKIDSTLSSRKDSEMTNYTFHTARSKESLFSSGSDKTLTESSQFDSSITSLPSDRADSAVAEELISQPLAKRKPDEQGDDSTLDQSALTERSTNGSSSFSDSEISEEGDGDYTDSDLEGNIKSDDHVCIGSYLRRERNANPDLPSTVTTLEAPGGGKVYLVGTAHFSLESQEDVSKTIRETQPDAVMVELCKSRINILQLDEKTVLEEAQNMCLEKIRSAIKQSGFVQGVMYLLLLSMSAHLTKELGMAPGGEFRCAFTEAKRVPGCLIHLGDRPIQITLQRALAALSLWQKIRLAWCMITSKDPISKEEVERCKQRDLLEELLAQMTGEFPALTRVFVQERDIYLTHSLHLAINSVCGPKHGDVVPAVVVGVVGIGHVPGIVQNWSKISDADIPPLLKIPEPTVTGKIIRYSLRASLLGLMTWGCWRILPIQKISNFVVSNLPPLRKS